MPGEPPAALVIRAIRENERGELAERVAASWGSSRIVSLGRVHEAAGLECLLALDGERWVGISGYRCAGDECELVVLEAFERGHGIGSALLQATVDAARALNSRRLYLVTTNDNLDALRFYQRRGMHLVRIWADAETDNRRLKPEIPLVGDYGIQIRDELELEMVLR